MTEPPRVVVLARTPGPAPAKAGGRTRTYDNLLPVSGVRAENRWGTP